MIAFADWFPLLTIGLTFTAIGLLKVFGRIHHIVGGGGKPWSTRVVGSCPTWSRHLNVGLTMLFLSIGLSFLSILGWVIISASRH